VGRSRQRLRLFSKGCDLERLPCDRSDESTAVDVGVVELFDVEDHAAGFADLENLRVVFVAFVVLRDRRVDAQGSSGCRAQIVGGEGTRESDVFGVETVAFDQCQTGPEDRSTLLSVRLDDAIECVEAAVDVDDQEIGTLPLVEERVGGDVGNPKPLSCIEDRGCPPSDGIVADCEMNPMCRRLHGVSRLPWLLVGVAPAICSRPHQLNSFFNHARRSFRR
jgi:hypothetical protein